MQFLDLHTHQQQNNPGTRQILSLSLTGGMHSIPPGNPDVSIGLHPWFATLENFAADYSILAKLAGEEQVKMIGECGLDRMKGAPVEEQLIMLRKQILLAAEVNKPAILHCVKCFDELMALQKSLKPTVPLIVHGFNKHEELGQQLMDKGFYLSFGKAILNASSGAAKLLKNSSVFFLETDDADCGITEIYQAAANLKNCTVDEMQALVFTSWDKINLI